MRPGIVLLIIWMLLVISCQQKNPSGSERGTAGDFAGTFVSDGYTHREEGYDWVGIFIDALSDTTAHVAVRSRIDQKKATCTFDSDARLTPDGTLVIPFEDKRFILSLSGDSLKIGGSDEKSKNLLYYFCSGGATLQGAYSRLDEPIDEDQLSGEGFKKDLSLQGVTFKVEELKRGFETLVSIEPEGLGADNRPLTHRIFGWVLGAETEDLNSDGFPELLVYVRSSEGGVRTRVIGYSVNNGKSMSRIFFPEIQDDPEVSLGYLGYDEFAIVETSLVQRFPVFNATDEGFQPTGMTRHVQYRLEEGEAARRFTIDHITTY